MTSALLAVASILLPMAILLGVIVCAFVGAALLLGLSELIADEARGWLELTPRGILRLVAMRLPAGQREAIYSEEWLPELLCKMRKGEERPISRLIIGARYAISMARGAGKVGRELQGVRNHEPETQLIEFHVAGTADEYIDVYREEYGIGEFLQVKNFDGPVADHNLNRYLRKATPPSISPGLWFPWIRNERGPDQGT